MNKNAAAPREYPEPGDPQFTEYAGGLYSVAEIQQAKSYEETHGSAKNAADEYVKSVIDKGTILRANHEKTVEETGEKDIVHVHYRIAAIVKGKSLENQPVYVVAFKRNGLWFASPNLLIGARGLPPAVPNFGRPSWVPEDAIMRPGQDFSLPRPKIPATNK